VTTPATDVLSPAAPPAGPLDAVLQHVNRIRVEHGVDPLYELPPACSAWDGGGCVLERAFADLGVVVVDYLRAYGPGVEFEHGLRGFICGCPHERASPAIQKGSKGPQPGAQATSTT
jgi:hypothetical protein